MALVSRIFCWALTGGKIVVADKIYRGRFLFASKNCENIYIIYYIKYII
jgi:hypothetical protein